MTTPPSNLIFFDTYIDPSAPEQVAEVLRSGRLSEGPLVKQFEEALHDTLGLRAPVAVNSGTSALRLALAVAGVGPGDEVIIPAQTFIASGLAVLEQGAVPVFADIDYATGNIDPASVEARITPRTKAIMPVHWGGLPVDLDALTAIAREHNLVVIEDAAHALGATYQGAPIGTISDFTCFSFQAIKHLTTGDGGAVCALDDAHVERLRARRWFGIDRAHALPSPLGERIYDVPEVGYKYHLNDYAAALGLANLTGFIERLARRRAVAAQYREGLKDVPGLTLFDAPENRKSAWWLIGMHVERRDDFVATLAEAGVPASVVHVGIDRNSVFGGLRSDLPNQRRFDETQIHLPIHDRIGPVEATYIIEVIRSGW